MLLRADGVCRLMLIRMHMAANGYAARKTKIAFNSTRDGNSEIYVMDSEGGNPLRLTHDPAWDHEPSWSPHGDRIAFNRYGDIYVMGSGFMPLKYL